MKTALYHCPGYAPREYACEPGSEKGLLNLLDAAGEVVVRGVPVYDDPDAIEGKPNGYCTPVRSAEKPAPKKTPAKSAPTAEDAVDEPASTEPTPRD